MVQPSANFIADKNRAENTPIWLYRIAIDDTPANDLFLAQSKSDVSFYKTDSGVNAAQTYTAFPIRHSGLKASADGEVSSVSVQVGNIRYMADGQTENSVNAFIEQNDGLRGKRVTIRRVFAEHLADPDAYQQSVYQIDSCSVGAKLSVFSLRPKLGIVSKLLPRRSFHRNYCGFCYKSRGCWIDNGDGTFAAPTGFSLSHYVIYGAEISASGSSIKTANAKMRFHERSFPGVDLATDSLIIQLKCSDPTAINPDVNSIRITSSGGPDDECLYLHGIDQLVADEGGTISTAYKTFTIPLADFTVIDGGPNFLELDYIRVYCGLSAPATVYWREAALSIAKPYGYAMTTLDTCNKSVLDCERHNNIGRFGGFPNIPARSRIVV